MTERRFLYALVALFAAMVFIEPKDTPLFDPDETRYTEIPREMLERGDMLTPRLNGTNYFEKPPLTYWANAASLALFGETPFAARLPTRLAFIGTAVMLILALGGAAGWWAALFLLSAPLPFALGRIVLTDGILTFCMTATFLAARRFLQEASNGRRALGWELTAGVAAGLGFLAKGLIAWLFPGLVIFLWAALFREWKALRALLFSWAPLVAGAVAAPWFLLMEKEHGGFLHFFFIREHFQRFTSPIHDRTGPPWYFLVAFVGGFLPWLTFYAARLRALLLTPASARGGRRDEWFFLIWTIVIILFFSASSSKLPPYILPAFPAAAALLGLWMAEGAPGAREIWIRHAILWTAFVPLAIIVGMKTHFLETYDLMRPALMLALFTTAGAWAGLALSTRSAGQAMLAQGVGWAAFFAVIISVLPVLSKDYSNRDLARAAQSSGADTIVAYKCYAQGFPWELKRFIPVADFKGELASDHRMDPAMFWSHPEFWARWNSGERLAVVIHKKFALEFDRPGIKDAAVLGRSRHNILVANFRPEEAGPPASPNP